MNNARLIFEGIGAEFSSLDHFVLQKTLERKDSIFDNEYYELMYEMDIRRKKPGLSDIYLNIAKAFAEYSAILDVDLGSLEEVPCDLPSTTIHNYETEKSRFNFRLDINKKCISISVISSDQKNFDDMKALLGMYCSDIHSYFQELIDSSS